VSWPLNEAGEQKVSLPETYVAYMHEAGGADEQLI
jgi:hypothetical protein